ncbi:MAG: D-glycero-beta-D-manno-heptose 1-phosphate adenylyltransferase [Candidatus Marinimicrobia bacterium]|nr:D-glycero-beta-D-manno-heptose 1-phosphate adenylyltransferase [Candidatus Neomarinimicrobiota bacterium]
MVNHDPLKERWIRAREIVQTWQKKGELVVFTNGCFDILHVGHVRYLQAAANLGNHLVIGLNTDESIRRLKGPGRPFQNEKDREEILMALAYVDLVVPFSQETPLEIITWLKPDILVKGGDYTPETIVGAREIVTWGGKVITLPYYEGKSTSDILKKIEKMSNSL